AKRGGLVARGGTAAASRLGFEARPRPGSPRKKAQRRSDDQTQKANPSAVNERGVARESAPPDTGEPPVTGERMRETPHGSAKGPEDYGKEPTVPGGVGVTESDPALDAALSAKFGPAAPAEAAGPAALARAAEAPEGTVPPGLQAMARRVTGRARPTQTERLPIGTEPAILEAGAQRAAEPQLIKTGERGPHDVFDIQSRTGTKLGELALERQDDGKTLRVEWIGDEKGTHVLKNQIGPVAIRALLDQIRQHYPDAESLIGFRGTGARRAAA